MWLIVLLFALQGIEEPLIEAARTGDTAALQSLLDSGADIDVGNRYGATPLFFAAERGDLAMVTLLIESGARVDVEDTFYQMAAIDRALMGEHLDVVGYLLANGSPGADDILVEAVVGGNTELVGSALRATLLTRKAYDRGLEIARGEGSAELVRLFEAREPPEGVSARAPSLTPEELRGYVGRYQNDALGRVLAVELTDGVLVLSGEPSATLRPSEENRFEFVGGDGEARFVGRGGMVERLVIHKGGEATAFRPIDESESREAAPVDTADVIAHVDVASAKRGPPAPWPAFRGANRAGIADGQGLALEWSETRNVRFKIALPGFSVASPIISGDRVFVVSAVSGAGNDTVRTGLYGDVRPVDDLSEHRWLLFALDVRDGSVVWERELHRGVPETKRHPKSSQANATPLTDGKHIVTVLGTVGLITCHDVDGNLVWKKDIGVRNVGWFWDPDYQWGHSSSPILYGDTFILQSDAHNDPFIAAYRIADGEEVWRTPRDGELPTFSTPAIYRGSSGDELVTNGTVIRGYDPKTGELLWHLAPNSELAVGAPVTSDELIYVTAGYPPIRPIYAIRPGSRGDLALPEGVDESEALAWSKDRGGSYIPSPLVYRGYFYTNANNGRLTCYDAATGERIYRARIGGVGGSYAASPIAADGRLYFTSEDGETFVVSAGAEYQLLAKNTLNGTVLSTPAASDGLLVIRTLTHVYGIAEP
jgi:outer membrane protein assembly factor BamB